MGHDFVISFAAGEREPYVEHFRASLAGELSRRAGRRVRHAGAVGGAGAAPGSPVGAARALVCLCSPRYYRDRGCGWHWSVFEHRLALLRSGRSAAAAGPDRRVLVRWEPAEPPRGLPRAPVPTAAVLSAYAERGLLGIMDGPGRNAEEYRAAVRSIAAAVLPLLAPPALPALTDDEALALAPLFPARTAPPTPPILSRPPGPSPEADAQQPSPEPGFGPAGGPHLFYVAYAPADRECALWVAAEIRKLRHHTELDLYDWAPGRSVTLSTQEALTRAHRVVCLLSPDFVAPGSRTSQVWADAHANPAPDGSPRLLPVLVRETALPALLRDLVPVRLFDQPTPEDAAAALARAVNGVGGRPRPTGPPPLPG
jgi:hypothetical protein